MSSGTALPPRTSSRKQMPQRSPKKKFRWGRFFLYLFLLILLIAACIAGYLYYKLNHAVNNIADPGPITTADGGKQTPVPAAESVKVKPVSLVLLGLDTRKKTGSLNTDVMMVATFNPKTKSAVVVSIPRDSKLDLEGYKEHKANAYYAGFHQNAHDKGLKGAEAEQYARDHMKTMLGEYFGIPISYTAIINFQGFSDVVDALGGVDVNVDMDMHYVDHADGTDIDLDKGFQHLDGDQTLDFVRYRKSNDGKNMSSDFDRNKRQSEVLAQLTDKMKSLSGIAKVGDVIDAVGDNMSMDMPADEIRNMIKAYFGISKENITFIPLEGVWRSPYVYPDEASVAKARQALKDMASAE